MFVYKIQHKTDDTLIYIGSTDDFDMRYIRHRRESECHRCYGSRLYHIIRANGGWCMFNCQVIDVVITDDGDTLKSYEQHYIDKFNSTSSMNTRNAHTDAKQYKKLYQQRMRMYQRCVNELLHMDI